MTPSAPAPTSGTEVPFVKIADAMARRVCQDGGATPMRALVATVVAVGPTDRLGGATEVLQSLADAGTVRGILISEGDNAEPPARVAGNTVALHGLKPRYVNNAVAALRLSSLPTLVWWRGGLADTLDGLADLADRIVLDDEEPRAIWARAVTLFEESAFSDVRWARLTQWRALMAHFFDIPEVQAACAQFTRLEIRARDPISAALLAAWLTSTIRFNEGFAVDVTDAPGGPPVQEVRLGRFAGSDRLDDDQQELMLRLAGSESCLETSVSVRGHRSASRVVSVRDQSLIGVLTGELRIRARDMAFERAVQAIIAEGLPVGPRPESSP
jgi:glucose-6-phosphate dehydrogenase assembly protein OpcA